MTDAAELARYLSRPPVPLTLEELAERERLGKSHHFEDEPRVAKHGTPGDPDYPHPIGGGASGDGGGGVSGVEMVSPSVAENLSFDEAERALHSARQQEVMAIAPQVDAIVHLQSHHAEAIGAWKDGAENSIIVTVSGTPTYEQLAVSAAMKGYLADQKGVIPFLAEEDGPDAMYVLEAPSTNLKEVHEQLEADGVVYHTLEPHAGGTRVWVFDQGSALTDTISKVGYRYGTEVTQIDGRGEFLGGDTRAEGRARYEEVISKHLEQDQRVSWERLRDHWRETHPVIDKEAGPRRLTPPRVVRLTPVDSVRARFKPGCVYVEKYSEDQPRDDQGQWTSGGGDGGSDDADASTPSADTAPAQRIGSRMLEPVAAHAVARAERELAKEGYPPEHMTSQLEHYMDYARANPAVWQEGMEWYAKEHELAQQLAAASNGALTEDAAAGVLAAESPMIRVDEARDAAGRIARRVANDGAIEVTPEIVAAEYRARLALAKEEGSAELRARANAWQAQASKDIGAHDVLTDDPLVLARWDSSRGPLLAGNWAKGLRIARGESPDEVLSGPKVRSFYDNIRDPEGSDAVTIDGRMVLAMTNPRATEAEVTRLIGHSPPRQTTGRYEVFSRRVIETAERYHVNPKQAQAIVWTALEAEQKAGGG